MRASNRRPRARAMQAAPANKRPRLSGPVKETVVATRSAPSSQSHNSPSKGCTNGQKRLSDATRGQRAPSRGRYTSDDLSYDERSEMSGQWFNETEQEVLSDDCEDDPNIDEVDGEDCGSDCYEEPESINPDGDDYDDCGADFSEVFEEDEEGLSQTRKTTAAGTKTSRAQSAQPSRGLTWDISYCLLTVYSKPDAIKYFDEKKGTMHWSKLAQYMHTIPELKGKTGWLRYQPTQTLRNKTRSLSTVLFSGKDDILQFSGGKPNTVLMTMVPQAKDFLASTMKEYKEKQLLSKRQDKVYKPVVDFWLHVFHSTPVPQAFQTVQRTALKSWKEKCIVQNHQRILWYPLTCNQMTN